jgi:ABC-type nitrate/sulfonate/bicarbonate transport system permease component
MANASLSLGAAKATPASAGSNTLRFIGRRIGRTLLTIVISAVVLGVLWDVTLIALHANSFIAKEPIDVWNYLFVNDPTSQTTAAANRANLFSLLWVTLGHASVGFAFGVGGAVVIALIFALVRPLEFMFMPIAMVFRTVPLLAMAPLIFLVFGTGLVTAAFVGGVLVFFPLLVNLALGFRSVSPQSVDLVSVYGGTRWTILRKVAIPTALPHFFASMRIAVPGSIAGAMLYEWLFTYQGLGAAITSAKSQSDYGQIWAIVVFVTVVSIVLYTIVTFIETAVLAQWGPNAGKTTGS